jgi:tRNA-specific 2-thiouridylase
MENKKRKRVLVAMSSGVDSSVAAALLQGQGYQVMGATLLVMDEASIHENIQRAQAVAAQLGMEHQVIDCRKEFTRDVLKPCWQAYQNGRTPNPCTLCNPRIKFAQMIALADRLGIQNIATGHHAQLEQGPLGPCLQRGHDENKDQSYFLYGLFGHQLDRCLFPIGDRTKAQVRQMAHQIGLTCAEQPDSQDTCIVTHGDTFAEYLRKRFRAEITPGQVIDRDGRFLGDHLGIHNYTIGQRKGLGIALGQRAWVTALNPETNRVVLSKDEQHLFSRGLYASDLHLHPCYRNTTETDCLVKMRYRHQASKATFKSSESQAVTITFEQPQRAITPGQAVVFYDGHRVMGGGIIVGRF